ILGAQSVGRLRDSRGIPLLLPLLRDRDSLTQTMAIFALGLIGDTAAVGPLVERARDATPVSQPAALELITAVARLGGGTAAGFIREVLTGAILSGRGDPTVLIGRAAQETWRLGRQAPAADLLGLVTNTKDEIRVPALYSLGRLRTAAAGPRMLDALRDR